MDKIAWGRSGLLAYIARGKVYITWLHCIDGEKWGLVRPVSVPISSDSEPVHLSWAASNYDLAIVDAMGRIQIAMMTSDAQITNHIVASFSADSRPLPSELDAVVGMHWLGLEKNMIVPVSSEENKRPWESVQPLGPFHPVKGRGAVVCVNGNGMLRLLVQLPDQHYTEVDVVMPGAEYLTHATFAPNGGTSLLVVTWSVTNGLVVYEATITWKPENMAAKKEIVQVKVVPVAEATVSSSIAPAGLTSLTAHRKHTRPGAPRADVEIRAITPGSVVYTFSLQKREESLHSAFFDLLSTSTSAEPPTPLSKWRIVLQGQAEDAPISKAVVTELLLLTVYTSGRIKTESLVPSTKIQFDQCGLEFDPEIVRNSKALCFSPNSTCMALFTAQDSPEPQLISLKNANEEVLGPTAVAIGSSLAIRYAHTVFNSIQCDDMLGVCWSLLHREISPKGGNPTIFFNILVAETQRLLNVTFVGPEDMRQVDRLIVIPSPLQRWLSLRMVLGTSKGWKRSPGCQLSFALLNMQILAFSLAWTIKKVSQRSRAQTPEQHQNEIASHCFHISNMLGLVRWLTDLVARVSQEVYLASFAPDTPKYEGTGPEWALLEESKVFTSLVLSSTARFLFKYSTRALRTLLQASISLVELEKKLQTGDMAKQTQRRLSAVLQTAPVPLDQFEKVLAEVDEAIKSLYAKQNVSDKTKAATDAELLKSAHCPTILLPVVGTIVQALKTHIKVDATRLYTYDTTWLRIDAQPNSHDDDLDIIRKRIILPHDKRKQCTRCGMLSVVEQPKVQGLAQWTLLFQRFCLCGGSWLTPDV